MLDANEPYFGIPADRTVNDCPNDHGSDGVIACWSPGGPCPAGQTACETCGPCQYCQVEEVAFVEAPEDTTDW